MSATLIPDALPGEDLLGIEPELRQQVDPGWLHRLNLFSGRTLTSPALQSEQLYRAGRLAILGQCVTQGTVKGLELSADLTASEPAFQVAPGYGISATGEDVALLRPLQTKLKNLQVIDPQTGDVLATFPGYANDPSHNNYAGVLLLQPVTGQVSGASIDTGTAPLIVSGNLAASCDQDPQEYAFEDWQTVDGVRLVLVAWPPSPTTLMLPSVTPAASWRNRLAYTIFNAEMQLGPEDRLPWDMLGVPVALVGFDSGWNPQFVDRAAVVRAGGLPRRRYVLPADPAAPGPLLVQPALAQARVSQLSEQIGPLTLTSLVPSFAFLPPCGLLPAQAIDFEHHVAPWFPTNWTIQVGPIHQEEIETALLAGMTAMPLDVTQSESVEVLVPLPDALYDPRILLTEIVDPAFRQAVDSATQERAGVLQHRKAIQQEANAQSQALTGNQQALPYDLDAGLTSKEIDDRDTQLYSPTDSETFGTTAFSIVSPGLEQVDYFSDDIQSLLDAAGNAPYTIANDGNGKPLASPLPLFSPDDLNDMAQNGLQHFIDRINAKVSRANDLLDLAFLTAQADIYRFRQFILGSADATRLAVSPIVANIATGESAAATATNLQTYLSSILPAAPAATTPTPNPAGAAPLAAATSRALSLPTTLKQNVLTTLSGPAIQAQPQAFLSATAPIASRFANLAVSQSGLSQVSTGTTGQAATTGDVLGQSALVGAQLNVRTITIAERMQTTPSQDGIFYSVGNRLSFLQLLATLEITIADIPILVDQWPPATTPAPPASTAPAPPVAAASYPTFADLKSTPAAVLQAVQSPRLNLDSDEADLFSTGIRVLEQHTTLLRAVEGRIAQYNDFLGLCLTSLANIQGYLPQARTLLTQLENDLAQARQDLAFTTSLLKDECQRVDAVNTRRANTLSNVPILVYRRPRTVAAAAEVPSRQLVPGNIASPVPSCLQQSVAIPPELREIVALLREAPVNWLPSIQALLNKLERPNLLQAVAVDAQARATMQLQLPPRISSAAAGPGVYATTITGIYGANQQAFRAFQTQRAAFQPVQLVNQSWTSQIQVLQTVTAAGDLLSSSAVHSEVVNATSRVMQQISSVATCLYARVGQALPIDRLTWAEFMRGLGVNIQMQSLAVLPNWNTQDYVSRQQMQMLVDWLFQQIDTNNSSAVAFLSDVVRVAILLASDAPVDGVITGAVTLAATPKVGGVISLTLPNDRVAHGMFVQLYNAGVLTAQAVVTDLDNSAVRATVTQVFQPNVALQTNDVAHFTAQAPHAVALRAFDM